MISSALSFVATFIGLILLQVLLLNNVVLHHMFTPYIYPIFILLLPFRTPPVVTILLGLALGLSVDAFSNTGGMHGLATVFMAFMRSAVIRIFTPHDGYETEDQPTFHHMGAAWFFLCYGSLLLMHHAVYFTAEVFSLNRPFYLIWKIILSTAISLLITLVMQLFIIPGKSKKLA